MALFQADPRRHHIAAEEAGLFLQETAVQIARHGREGAAFLLDQVRQVEADRLRAILLSFAFVGEETLRPVLDRVRTALVAALASADAGVVAQAVDTANQLGLLDLADAIKPLAEHESPFVVGSVLRFLSEHFPAQARPILIRALQSPEPIVRQNAIDELDDLECKEALPSIVGLLNDPDADVREAAQWAARHLAS
jgi:HEAT repeat protein